MWRQFLPCNQIVSLARSLQAHTSLGPTPGNCSPHRVSDGFTVTDASASRASSNVRGGPSGLASARAVQHPLARVTSVLRDELDLARIPPDPPDRLYSFPLALLSSFDIEHPLPHAVLNLTASEMHASGMGHAPRLSTISFNKSFPSSVEREEVSPCTCTHVVLSKGAISSVGPYALVPLSAVAISCTPRHVVSKPSPPPRSSQPMWSHSWSIGHRFPITIKKSEVPEHSGGLSGSTCHFLSPRDHFLTYTTHGAVVLFLCRARKRGRRGKTEHTGQRKDHEQRPLSDSICFSVQQSERFQVGWFPFPDLLKTYHGVVIHLISAGHARMQCASASVTREQACLTMQIPLSSATQFFDPGVRRHPASRYIYGGWPSSCSGHEARFRC